MRTSWKISREGYKDGQKAGSPQIMETGERVGAVSLEKKRLWGHLIHLPVPKGSLQKTFYKGM